jgi:acyl-CoA synthetase (NDP forming)
VLLTIGAGAASSRLARSHTGSLTSRMDVVDAACRRFGVPRVDTPAELLQVARAYLARAAVPAGRRVAIIGDSGGQCGVAADQAGAAGLAVPAFRAPVTRALTEALPAGAATANPVDLAGAGERDLGSYAATAHTVLASDDVDAVLLTGYFGRYGEDVPELGAQEQGVARRLAEVAAEHGKPLVVHRAAMAKLTASETAMFTTWAAVQTLGGWGYSREHPVEQWMRDVKLEEIEEGTSDIMRLVISRNLG